MAAPRRTPIVATMVPENQASGNGVSLLAQSQATAPPMRVRAPGSPIDDAERSLVRFSQIIMLGIAVAGIWLSIYRIAFDGGETTNEDFAVLFFGGCLLYTSPSPRD